MDIVERLRRDADRWMAGDMGRDNEEAGWLSDEAATEIETLRAALKAERERCAVIAEEYEHAWGYSNNPICGLIAADIRALAALQDQSK